MPKKKNSFINKIVKKNYETELENVLEIKSFDETSKSLLLSMLYKIEDSYKDYKTVKRDTISKEEYIESLINVISEKCDVIKLKEINESEKNKKDSYKVDVENKTIECYPIEKELLYSIAKINKKEHIVKNRIELINNSMTNLMNSGSNIEIVEPLRDFNGWSWNTEITDIENIECNLTYQIMRLLVGNKFLVEWIKNREKIIDYLEYFENEMESKVGQEISEKILEDIIKISILVDIKENKELKSKWLEVKKDIDKQYEKINNKKAFVEELTATKIQLNRQIEEKDKILNDRSKLKEEYKNRNEKLELTRKIFSIRVLEKILIEERQELVSQIKECNKILKPKNYFSLKNDLETKVKIFSVLEIEKESDIEKVIGDLEKNYLKCMEFKIKKAKKEELIELLYELRYFCQIPYNNKNINFEFSEINVEFEKTSKRLVQKCIANKIITTLGTNKEIITLISKILFNTKIIELENVYIEIKKSKDGYLVQIYDENVIDKSYKLEKDVQIDESKINKKIKILNK